MTVIYILGAIVLFLLWLLGYAVKKTNGDDE